MAGVVNFFVDHEMEINIILSLCEKMTFPEDQTVSFKVELLQKTHPNTFLSHLAGALLESRRQCCLSLKEQCFRIANHLSAAERLLDKSSSSEIMAFEKVRKITDQVFDKYDFTLSD